MRLLLPLAAFLSLTTAASNLVFKTISVQMGAVGSDDDIRARVCDRSKCCTTKVGRTFFHPSFIPTSKKQRHVCKEIIDQPQNRLPAKPANLLKFQIILCINLCMLKVLSNLLSGEWRAKKAETWDGSKLGNCSSILFSDALSNIELSLVKAGKKADGLDVTNLSLTGQVGADKKKLQTFKCGAYKVLLNYSSCHIKTNWFCQPVGDNSTLFKVLHVH